MTTFDKFMLFIGAVCTTLTGAGIANGLPKWLTITALCVGAGCTAVAPSIMASKRVPAPADPTTPKP